MLHAPPPLASECRGLALVCRGRAVARSGFRKAAPGWRPERLRNGAGGALVRAVLSSAVDVGPVTPQESFSVEFTGSAAQLPTRRWSVWLLS